jgi:hypothetical protein
MSKLSRSVTIEAPAERVFAYVDDIRNLARHMSESRSMPMMGSKLKLEIMTPEPTSVEAVYRYSGRMMGLTIDFSETVTRYVAGREKVWRTIGEPQLLIIAGMRCGSWWSRYHQGPRASRLASIMICRVRASGCCWACSQVQVAEGAKQTSDAAPTQMGWAV